MNVFLRAAGFSLMALFASCGVGAQAQAQSLDTRLGPINMQGELPSRDAIAKRYAELDFQLAIQAYL